MAGTHMHYRPKWKTKPGAVCNQRVYENLTDDPKLVTCAKCVNHLIAMGRR